MVFKEYFRYTLARVYLTRNKIYTFYLTFKPCVYMFIASLIRKNCWIILVSINQAFNDLKFIWRELMKKVLSGKFISNYYKIRVLSITY